MLSCQFAAAYTVHGAGNISCGQWTATKGARYNAEGWVQGYISAYDMHVFKGENVAKGIDAAGLFGWIDNYCATHQLDDVWWATDLLVHELVRRSGEPP